MTEKTNPGQQLILFETFELIRGFDEYEATLKAWCRRVEQDGVPGIRLIQSYVARERNEAYIFVIFSSADAYKEHLDFNSQIDEFRPFFDSIKIKDIKAFGCINEEQSARLKNHDFPFDLVSEHVAGMVRN